MLPDTPGARGRKAATTPAATVVAANTRDRRSCPSRTRLDSSPAGWAVALWPAGLWAAPLWRAGCRPAARWPAALASHGIASSGTRAATAVSAMTVGNPACPASQTPDGSATTAGTLAAMPDRPSPSPRRSGGTRMATCAPVTTVLRPKPTPRTMLTATIVPRDARDSSARVGTPSSTAPAARTLRYPNLLIAADAASSATTVPSRSVPVTSPAPAVPAPAAAAYIGVTDSGRKKLVRVPKVDRSTIASGTVMIRPLGRLPTGSVRVKVLMLETVGVKWNTDKVQYDVHSVGRLEPGAASAARSRQRSAAACAA